MSLERYGGCRTSRICAVGVLLVLGIGDGGGGRGRPYCALTHLGFDAPRNDFRFIDATLLREPAGTFRDREPDEPDHERACRSEKHDPAPSFETERRGRNQQIGEERRDRCRREHHRLVECHGAAAHVLRHKLEDVHIDRDDLESKSDAGDEALEHNAVTGSLECHDH